MNNLKIALTLIACASFSACALDNGSDGLDQEPTLSGVEQGVICHFGDIDIIACIQAAEASGSPTNACFTACVGL